MKTYSQKINWKDKKVTIMGLGLYENGSGISAAKFFVDHGAKVTITDLKTEVDLAQQIKRLGDRRKKIKWVLGRHEAADFMSADLIMKNPGVRNTSDFLKIAQKNKIPIETDISVFFQMIDKQRIIGITGTRGKSTTTTLIFEILKLIDKNAVLGGNILVSPLAQMKDVERGGAVVLELSSWMLESLESIKLSPHLSVVTNIYPDHLNTYNGIDDYAAAKENIFLWQDENDIAIFNKDNKWTRAMGKKAKGKRFWFSLKFFDEENGAFIKAGSIYFRKDGKETKIIPISKISLPGEHNLANVLAATCVAMAYGIKPNIIARAIINFKGVPHRLQLLREFKGVKYYNDTTSTTPEATIAALKALQKSRIILIAGGADKGLDFSQLSREIKQKCHSIVFLAGSGTDRLVKFFKNSKKSFTVVNSMADAIGVAKSQSKKGDIILLSPACASFGLFKNEFDRGDQFVSLVAKLK